MTGPKNIERRTPCLAILFQDRLRIERLFGVLFLELYERRSSSDRIDQNTPCNIESLYTCRRLHHCQNARTSNRILESEPGSK